MPTQRSQEDAKRDMVGETARAFLSKLDPVDLHRLASLSSHSITVAARKAFQPITNWTLNDKDPLGDGDQSSFDGNWPGTPGFVALCEWGKAPELNFIVSPLTDPSAKLEMISEFGLMCAYGNIAEVQRILDSCSTPEAKIDLVARRSLSLRMSPLMLCIAGSRWVGQVIQRAPGMNHTGTAKLLIAAGAPVAARDVCGYSCLYHATTSSFSSESLAIAQLLIKAGADVNTRTRTGKTPLHEAIMQNKPPPAALLLEAGANPDLDFMVADVKNCPAPMRAQLQAMIKVMGKDALRNPPRKMAASASSSVYRMIVHCTERGRIGAGHTLEGEAVQIRDSAEAGVLRGQIVQKCGPFDPIDSVYVITTPDGTLRVPAYCVSANRNAGSTATDLAKDQGEASAGDNGSAGAMSKSAKTKARKNKKKSAVALAADAFVPKPPTPSSNNPFMLEGFLPRDLTGLRVRVHGLINKPEFNNETGMVTGLVDAQGARWCVQLDNYRKELSLKLDNLMVLDEAEAEAGCGPAPKADLEALKTKKTEKTALVCKAHGLEVCGACVTDLRSLKSKKSLSVPPAEASIISIKKLGAQDAALKNLDPSVLTLIVDTSARSSWGGRGPLQQAFTNKFSITEKMMSKINVRPSIEQDLTFHVRETLLTVAAMIEVDKCRCKIIQDDAKDLGIVLLVTGLFALTSSNTDDDPPPPVILVWYQTNSVTDPMYKHKMQSLAFGMKEARRVGAAIEGEVEIISHAITHRKEVEALKMLLEHNSKLLAPAWLAAHKPPPSFTASFLTPLRKKTISHEAGEGSGSECSMCVCGTPQPKLKCSRCSSMWYCSSECQKSDWKVHKGACKKPEERSGDDDTVVVRVGRDDPVLGEKDWYDTRTGTMRPYHSY
jgi:hypothetical protein